MYWHKRFWKRDNFSNYPISFNNVYLIADSFVLNIFTKLIIQRNNLKHIQKSTFQLHQIYVNSRK